MGLFKQYSITSDPAKEGSDKTVMHVFKNNPHNPHPIPKGIFTNGDQVRLKNGSSFTAGLHRGDMPITRYHDEPLGYVGTFQKYTNRKLIWGNCLVLINGTDMKVRVEESDLMKMYIEIPITRYVA